MGLRINHNISSINGHRQLLNNQSMLAKSLERLSSGLKINRAADGAAGLVISEQMRAQIAGLNQAVSNSETAVSMVQTTEGALSEVNTLLTKARELVLHAANSGVNDANQLAADQSELDNVITSVSRISAVTQFGTKKLLDGSLDGATNLAATISHVNVGNLANNPGITAGQMAIAVSAGTQESITLKNTGATDGFIFTSTVTGLTMGSASVASGVSVALKLGNNTVSLVTTGSLTASTLASQLDALANPFGFKVTATSGGEMKVTNTVIGSPDFTSSLSFTRGATSTSAGNMESVKSTLQVSSPSTSSGAAAVLFSDVTGGISGIQETSTIAKSSTKFSYNLNTVSGGVFSGSVTAASGDTMATTIATLQSGIRALAGFSGATLALAGSTGAGQINFSLSRGDEAISADFGFSLSVDYSNASGSQSTVKSVLLSGSSYDTGVTNPTFTDSANVVIAGGAISATSKLGSGNAINLTVNGQTVTFSALTGGAGLTGVADALQASLIALGGDLADMNVRFLTGGASITGLTNIAVPALLVSSGAGFVVYNSVGKTFSVSLAVDAFGSGNDVTISSTALNAGVQAGATLDLTTTAQTKTDNVLTVSGQAGRTISSTVGDSTVTSGIDATATMTSANGVVLNLKQTAVQTDGTITMTLTSGSTALGYKDFKAEIAASLGTNGGQSSFTLSEGAVFQVGANALQQVGLTIDSISSDDMGRGSSSSLTCLSDLLSSKKGALINGMSTDALKVIDASIDQITNLRGRLGAFQSNTLESGLNSLRVSNENLTAAESTIRDTDFASESAIFTKNQILVQASTSMLAQANQLPQNVLKLLG